MFKNFLVPLDGSVMAESVLPAVAQLSVLFKTRIILIHVIEKDAPQKIHGDRHLTDATQAQIYLDKNQLSREGSKYYLTDEGKLFADGIAAALFRADE